MRIHGNFTGGNIHVERIEGNEVLVRNEIRDTMEDWFYWAMCVEDAQGQTVTVHFDKKWIGYLGPAVSTDLVNWHWLGSDDETKPGDTFTYTFGPDESRVYFAHNMLYHPAHFDRFLERTGLEKKTLCLSESGNEVPYVTFGTGDRTVLMTARHHACEATGSYVLEGVLEELYREPIEGLRVVAIPFMDYDGVVHGDQGKSRAPWDHNRDYTPGKEPIYATVREARKIAAEGNLLYAFDFHSPWHVGGMNDWVFIPQKHFTTIKHATRFANLFEECITENSLPYSVTGTCRPNQDWNKEGSPCFGTYMHYTGGAELSFTLETPYFLASGVPFTADRAREMGRCFARALREYHSRNLKISITGDLLFEIPMNDWCRTDKGYDYLPLFFNDWGRIPDADYLVGNIETPVAGKENGDYTCERYCFNTPDEMLRDLKKIGFDLISLANNHAMDRGQEGIRATLDACDRAGLSHTGMYRTKEESEEVFVRELNGIRVAFVNATYGTNAFAHHRFLDEDKKFMVDRTMPEETLEGSIDLLKDLDDIREQVEKLYNPVSPILVPYLERLKEKIEKARSQADYVIMLLHSGGQFNVEADAYTKMLTEKIRSWGADLIIGNHPHIILPSEIVDGVFTTYCPGNLMSAIPGADYHCSVDPDYSAVINVTLNKADGKIEPHISFRLCRLFPDPDRKKAPVLVDTYDWYRKQVKAGEADPESKKQEILLYANRFMPGMNYTEPQKEYVIC